MSMKIFTSLCLVLGMIVYIMSLVDTKLHKFSFSPQPLFNRNDFYLNMTSYDPEPRTQEIVLEIDTMKVKMHGVHKTLITVNGSYPGPTIEATEGDTLKITLINKMPKTKTSLHFHGVHMKNLNYLDGADTITQCGIQPKNNLTYEFKVDTAGTNWYHSHTGLQYIEGFSGAFIVHPRRKGQIKEQRVLMLTDLYAYPVSTFMTDMMEPWLGGDPEPTPQLFLTNGEVDTEIPCLKGIDTQIRIINGGSTTVFRLAMSDRSKLKVIEADTTEVKYKEVDSLLVYPSQRYSILVNINETTKLFCTPQINKFEDYNPEDLAIEMQQLGAVLKLNLRTEERFQIDSEVAVQETEFAEPYFEPLTDTCPQSADMEVNVELGETRDSEGELHLTINGQAMPHSDSRNLLLKLMQSERGGTHHGMDKRHAGHHDDDHDDSHDGMKFKPLLEIDETKTVDLIIRSSGDEGHPFHLHGHSFYIVSRGNETSTWEAPVAMKRDTVWVPSNQWARIRFVTDNPGIWMFHCHNPWHAAMGMSTYIISHPTVLKEYYKNMPSSWFEWCSPQT